MYGASGVATAHPDFPLEAGDPIPKHSILLANVTGFTHFDAIFHAEAEEAVICAD
jgi:hypothetical protein